MQNGVSCSIKPQQITFIVPGVENFDHSEISQFLQKAQDNLVGFSCILKMTTVVLFSNPVVKVCSCCSGARIQHFLSSLGLSFLKRINQSLSKN